MSYPNKNFDNILLNIPKDTSLKTQTPILHIILYNFSTTTDNLGYENTMFSVKKLT